MPLGREKTLIRFASTFSIAAAFRIPAPQGNHAMLLPNGGTVCALVQFRSIGAGIRTIVRAGDANSGYVLRQNGAQVEALVYGPGATSVTATGPRALVAADLDKWCVVALGINWTANLYAYLNGIPGAAADVSAFVYGVPTNLPIFIGAVNGGPFSDPALTIRISQVHMAETWADSIVLDGAGRPVLTDHYDASRRAMRLEEFPGSQLYVDMARYEGPVVSPAGITTFGPAFGELVRGARVEFANYNGVGSPPTVGEQRGDRTTDWVVV